MYSLDTLFSDEIVVYLFKRSFRVKKIHLALLTAGFAFSASALAFEGTIVKVPASNDHFFVGLEALYLQPSDSNGDLDYATVLNGTLPANGNILGIEPDFGWAWRLTLGYEYGAANDFTFNYFRAHPKSTSDDFTAGTGDIIIDPTFGVTAWDSVSSSVDYEVDQADFTMGQKLAPHRCITLHPFGGLRYARVKRDLDVDFTAGTTTWSFPDRSKYSGIGPIAGMDASFEIGNGFKIVGKVDGALLVGDMEDDFSWYISTPTSLTNPINYSVDKRRRVVPVVDMRLGAAYTWDMGNDSTLGFEVGYQVSTYKDSIDRINLGDTNSQPGDTAVSPSIHTPTRSSSSLGLHGAYLNLVWRM